MNYASGLIWFIVFCQLNALTHSKQILLLQKKLFEDSEFSVLGV